MVKSILSAAFVIIMASCSSSQELGSSGTSTFQTHTGTVGKPAAATVSAPSSENSAATPNAPAKAAEKHNN